MVAGDSIPHHSLQTLRSPVPTLCDLCESRATARLSSGANILGNFCREHAQREREMEARRLTEWVLAAAPDKIKPDLDARVYRVAFNAVRVDGVS